MTDWRMYVETFPDGTPQLPAVHAAESARPERVDDHAAVRAGASRASSPTRTTARRGASSRATSTSPSRGRPPSIAGRRSFSNGTVAIQNYVPMRADMQHDVQDRRRQGRARSDRPDDRRRRVAAHRRGRSDAVARADLSRARRRSTCRGCARSFSPTTTSRCRARATSTAPSTCSTRPSTGSSRTGRELKGNFTAHSPASTRTGSATCAASSAGCRRSLEVTNATAALYGGAARFSYRMAPLGQRGVPADRHVRRAVRRRRPDRRSRTSWSCRGFASPAGRRDTTCSSGRSDVSRTIAARASIRTDRRTVQTLTRQMTAAQLAAAEDRSRDWGAFSNQLPAAPVPIGGAT